jgi:hypothetical protein
LNGAASGALNALAFGANRLQIAEPGDEAFVERASRFRKAGVLGRSGDRQRVDGDVLVKVPSAAACPHVIPSLSDQAAPIARPPRFEAVPILQTPIAPRPAFR